MLTKLLIWAVCLVAILEAQVSNVAVRSIAVKGNLKCGRNAAENVKVVLFRVSGKEENQIMDTRTSSPSGLFEVNGNTNGRPINETDLDPVIRFYHRCDTADDKKKDSSRSFQIAVPKDQVTLGKNPRKTFDIGTINLELSYPKETWEKNVKKE